MKVLCSSTQVLYIMPASNILQYFMRALFSRLNICSVPSGVFSQSMVLVMEMVVATLRTSAPAPMKEKVQPSSLQSSISLLTVLAFHSFEAFSWPSVMIVTMTAVFGLPVSLFWRAFTEMPMASKRGVQQHGL